MEVEPRDFELAPAQERGPRALEQSTTPAQSERVAIEVVTSGDRRADIRRVELRGETHLRIAQRSRARSEDGLDFPRGRAPESDHTTPGAGRSHGGTGVKFASSMSRNARTFGVRMRWRGTTAHTFCADHAQSSSTAWRRPASRSSPTMKRGRYATPSPSTS